jgi:histidinol-phosphatase (PHP family)
MITRDDHVHSSFSSDCTSPMEEQVRAAIAAGLTEITFTEHLDMDAPYTNVPAGEALDFRIDYDAYREELNFLKVRYADRIQIHMGLELGLNASLSPALEEYVRTHRFDYIIGSTHSCGGMDPYYDSFFEGRTAELAFRAYFETALANVKTCPFFDSYGHLDYVLRYGPDKADGSDEQHTAEYYYALFGDLIDPILYELILNGKALELNTGALSRSFPEPNPCAAILRRYHDLGGVMVTVGSDAHTPENIGAHMDTAARILHGCGFDSYYSFEERTPIRHPL